jgi:hypothetical protein
MYVEAGSKVAVSLLPGRDKYLTLPLETGALIGQMPCEKDAVRRMGQ